MDVSITVDAKAVEEAFRKAPDKVTAGIKKWLTRSSLLAERASKKHLRDSSSRGASGRTLSSINSSEGSFKSEIRPNTKYAEWVEEGRRPGRMPPYQRGTDLEKWARRVGINPFLVARAIARKGTKPKKFMFEAYKEVKPKIERDGNDMVEAILRSI